MWAYCDADVAGRFDCSSPLLNAIYKMCVRSAQQNIQQGMISVDAAGTIAVDRRQLEHWKRPALQ